MRAELWSGRDVFVTGHTGFKGAWLCVLLHRLGARVHGYALPTPSSFLFHRADLGRLLASDVRGDIRDGDRLAAALEASGADVVLHLAAQSVVRESYRDPVETFSTNVDGTLRVVLAAQAQQRVRSCVVVTTDKVYRNNEWEWPYRENEPLGGHDPYSASKACTELCALSLAESFPREGLGVATARAGNVVGGGDATADALVPELIGAFAAGRPAELRHPEAIRPWQHVLEPLSGYLTLAEQLPGPAHAQGWNFGPSTEHVLTVGEVARVMAHAWGGDADWKPVPDDGPHEAGVLLLDSARARARLGWRPTLAPLEAFTLTVAWEQSVLGGATPYDATRAQVDDYLSRQRTRDG